MQIRRVLFVAAILYFGVAAIGHLSTTVGEALDREARIEAAQVNRIPLHIRQMTQK